MCAQYTSCVHVCVCAEIAALIVWHVDTALEHKVDVHMVCIQGEWERVKMRKFRQCTMHVITATMHILLRPSKIDSLIPVSF